MLHGNTEAFEALIQRYQKVLYAMALSRLRDPQCAREVVSDTFVQAYLSLNSVRDPDRFDAWLRTILHNNCLKTLGKRHRDLPLDEDLVDARPNPQEQLEAQEAARACSLARDPTPKSRAIRAATIAMVARTSISVKAARAGRVGDELCIGETPACSPCVPDGTIGVRRGQV